MFTYIFISLTVLTSPIASLESNTPFSLNQALNSALKHNRTLKEFVLKIKQSITLKSKVNSKFDTIITGGLTLLDKKAMPVSGNPINVTDVKQYGLKVGVAKFLKTGGMIALEASGTKQEQTLSINMAAMTGQPVPPSENTTTNYNTAITLKISHPLLQGFGVDITKADIKKAEIGIEAQRLSKQAKLESIIRDIITAYWDLKMAWKQYELLKTSLKVAKNQVKLTQSLFDNDFAKPSDLLAVKANVAQREGDLLLARTAILMSTTRLKNLMGMPLDKAPFIIKPTTDFNSVKGGKAGKELLKTAVNRSKDIAALMKQIEILRQDELKADNSLLPKLDAQFAFGPSVDNKEFSEAFKGMLQFDGFVISAGLNFQYSVGMNMAKSNLENLKLNKQIINLRKQNLASALIMASIKALDEYESANKRIEISKLAVNLAKQHLKNEMALFKAGRGTNHSVLLRMQELDKASFAYQKALRDKVVAWTQIRALSGEILKDYNIEQNTGTIQ